MKYSLNELFINPKVVNGSLYVTSVTPNLNPAFVFFLSFGLVPFSFTVISSANCTKLDGVMENDLEIVAILLIISIEYFLLQISD